MNRSTLAILATILLCQFAMAQEQRTFNLRSGEIITGQVVEESDSAFQIITSFGTITLMKAQIQPRMVEIELKDGNRIKGELLEQTPQGISVRTGFGDIFITADKIVWMGTTESGTAIDEGSRRRSSDAAGEIWYFSEERLMDIWFDPTGFALRKGEFYFSGLSWAFGFSDRIQLSSRWSNYFIGDLNFRPKLTIIETGSLESMTSVSVGGHVHTRGVPSKWEYLENGRTEYRFDMFGQPIDTVASAAWVQVGSTPDEFGSRSTVNADDIWYELFAAISVSKLNRGNKGRTNITAGASVIRYPNHDPLPRVYLAVDRDVRKNIKVMAEVFWDPFYVPIYDRFDGGPVSVPVFYDFGFMTNSITRNKKLWIGIHFQVPFLAFYFKF